MPYVDSLPFPPRPDESARGLLLRIGEDNLCTGNEICNILGLSRMHSPLQGDLDGAATALGIAANTLALMGASDDGETEVFLGHRVPVGMCPGWSMRFCPACMAEEPYHRRVWSHVQLGVCPRHRVMLGRDCPECRSHDRKGKLLWTRPSFAFCPENHAVAEHPVVPASGWRGHAAIYRMCGLACDGPDFPDPLRALPLQSLLDLLAFFGRMDLVVVRGNPDGIPGREMVTDPRVIEAGAEIAFGWPASFGELAARVKEARGEETGLGKQYGYLHRFVQRCAGQPYERLLQDAYAEHLASRDDISDGAWPSFLPKAPSALACVGPDGARELLGIGRRPFRRLMRQPLWAELVPQLRSRNGSMQFLVSSVMELRGKLNRLVTPAALDKRLGLGRGKGREMCDAGLLPVHEWNRNNRSLEDRSVDLADAAALFERVKNLTRPGAPRQSVTLAELLARAANGRLVGFADVMRTIISGQLRGHVTQPWKPGFASLSFELEDAVQVLEELAAPERCGKMCMREVVGRLGVTNGAVLELVAAGLLPEPDRRWAYVFETDAVQAFQEEYVLDVELARERAATPEEVRDALALVGVRPVLAVGLRAKGRTAGVFARTLLSPRA